jgi:hypothetical protein
MFPGLVNCTTINWFTEWPSDALYEVATRQMASENLGSEEIKQAVCKVRGWWYWLLASLLSPANCTVAIQHGVGATTQGSVPGNAMPTVLCALCRCL